MQKNQEQYFEIDLMRLLAALWHRAWIIILAAGVCAAAAFGVTKFLITPMYQADVLLYINNNRPEVSSDTVSQADLTASQSLAETYVAILNSRAVLNEAAHQAGGEYTESELQSMLSASVVNETELLRITVTGADPQDTASLANAVADVSSATMAETVDACNVQIVDRAEVPDSPSSPDILRNTALGLFLGILLSAAGIILRELTDIVIRSEKSLNTSFEEIPVLGVIPEMDNAASKNYGKYEYTAADRSENSGD